MSWDEWEQEPKHQDAAASTTEPVDSKPREPAMSLDGLPAMSRRQRRRSQRVIRSREAQSTRRAHLRDLEALPGLWVLGAAILVVILVFVVRSQRSDKPSDSSPSNADSAASTSSSADDVESVKVIVDPHAGAQVLPTKGMPPGPLSAEDMDRSTPQAAAFAFAAQACAVVTSDGDGGYADRLSGVATPQLAESWQHGTAERIHCLQISSAVSTQDADTASATVSAVQVYDDGTDELVAYRWAAVVQLAVVNGVWTVTA